MKTGMALASPVPTGYRSGAWRSAEFQRRGAGGPGLAIAGGGCHPFRRKYRRRVTGKAVAAMRDAKKAK
jgi:hypothetical protein